MLTVHTRAVDDANVAVAELFELLDLENRQLGNAVGILAFHPEFMDPGVIEALGEALPFPTAGHTSLHLAADGALGDIMPTVAVLTSKDSACSAGISAPIDRDAQRALEKPTWTASKAILRDNPDGETRDT
jgi:hypothetical protein